MAIKVTPPRSYNLRSINPRIKRLYPGTDEIVSEIDAFTPAQADPGVSFTLRDEDARGPIEHFTPASADKADGLGSVRGYALEPQVAELPTPSSPLEPEMPGYDAELKPEGPKPAPKSSPDVTSYREDAKEDFPDQPRPDMRMIKQDN